MTILRIAVFERRDKGKVCPQERTQSEYIDY